jgi:hypothetical protein
MPSVVTFVALPSAAVRVLAVMSPVIVLATCSKA